MATTVSRSRKPSTRLRPGRASRKASGRTRSTFAISSSRTTRPTTATPTSSRRRRSARPRIWKKLTDLFPEERRKGVLDVSQIPSSITAHAPGLHRPRQRNHRRTADRSAAPARDHAERRFPDGRQCAENVRLRTRPQRRRGIHQVPQDAQRRRLRRLHGRRAGAAGARTS